MNTKIRFRKKLFGISLEFVLCYFLKKMSKNVDQRAVKIVRSKTIIENLKHLKTLQITTIRHLNFKIESKILKIGSSLIKNLITYKVEIFQK